MELHQLRCFLAVAEEGRFSRATARYGVAQPSLSQQVQKLDREPGRPLGLCRRKGTDLNIVMRGEQLATILHMVALGLGLSLVPQMVARADRSARRVYRPLTDEEPQRTIVVAWHLNRYRTNASRAFIEALKRSEKR